MINPNASTCHFLPKHRIRSRSERGLSSQLLPFRKRVRGRDLQSTQIHTFHLPPTSMNNDPDLDFIFKVIVLPSHDSSQKNNIQGRREFMTLKSEYKFLKGCGSLRAVDHLRNSQGTSSPPAQTIGPVSFAAFDNFRLYVFCPTAASA
jgi:hypothetical protein